jgi:hypothetical protein
MKKTLHIDERLLQQAKSVSGAPNAGELDALLSRDEVSDFVYGELLIGDTVGRFAPKQIQAQ